MNDEDLAIGDMPGEHVGLFEDHRPRLMGICYRILGTVNDAEDVLREAWIRWRGTELNEVQNAEAFLTTIVTRLSLDRLRRVKAQREVYTGSWLPEPVAVDDPQAAVELADSLSLALLVVLETLSPVERAAFVLREVFQQPTPRWPRPWDGKSRPFGSLFIERGLGWPPVGPGTRPTVLCTPRWWSASSPHAGRRT